MKPTINKNDRRSSIYKNFISPMKSFGRKVWKSLTHKITVMLVPQTEKESLHLQISPLVIFLALGFVITLVIVGLFSITESVRSDNRYEKLMNDHVVSMEELTQFKESVPRLNEVFFHLNEAVQKLNHATGDDTMRPDVNNNQFNAEYLAKRVLESDATQYNEIADLLKVEYNIEKLVPEIESVAIHLEKYKKLFDVIPSINPVVGNPYVVSDFGWRYDPFTGKRKFHNGVDLKESMYTEIRAAASGKVTRSKYSNTAGNHIAIEHEFGFSTVYMHLAKMCVGAGQSVVKGQVIGLLGSTGRSQGPHLHYEVRINGKKTNPTPYLRLNRLNGLSDY